MKAEPEAFGYKASSEDYNDIADIFRTTLRYRRFPCNLRPFAERLFFTCCLLAEYRGPANILIPFAKGAWDMWENDGRHETGNGTYSNALWRFLASRGGASKVHRLQGDDLAKYIYLEVKAYRKEKWKEINHIKNKSCLEIENRYKEIKMVLDAIGRLTPQKLLQLYPVTKEYDGERWDCKDYFYTMDKLKQWPPDKPIGTAQEVACLLWDYQNTDLEIMLLQWLNAVDDLKIYCNKNGPSDRFHDLMLKKGRDHNGRNTENADIKQCAAYFKEQDPDSGLGEWRIRQMVNQGEIPVYRAGRRILINLDTLITHVAGETPAAEEKEKALN